MKDKNVNIQASEEVSYDTIIKNDSMIQNRERVSIRQICAFIDDTVERTGWANPSILEIGFNDGSRFRELCEIYKYASFTGLEVREKQVEDMIKQGYDCRLVKTEIFDEFFENGEKFDIIFGFAVLHHMSDPYKTLESIMRLLKPGGVLLFIREAHKYDVLSHLYTTLRGNWAYEKNTLKVKSKLLKELLARHTTDYSVEFDNNGLVTCFERFSSFYCKLKLNKVPLWNGITIIARVGADNKSE